MPIHADQLSWFERAVVWFFGRNWPNKRLVPANVLMFAGLGLGLIGWDWFQPLDEGTLCLRAFALSLPLIGWTVWRGDRLVRQGAIHGKQSCGGILAVMVLTSLMSLGFLSIGTGVTLNGWLDPSAPTTHTGRVLARWISSKSYYVRISSWRHPNSSENIRISRTVFNQVQPSVSQMSVTTKRGALGFEWVAGYRLE